MNAVFWAEACAVGVSELVCPGVVMLVGVLEMQIVACTVLDQGHFHQHASRGDVLGLVAGHPVGTADVVSLHCEAHVCALLWALAAYFPVEDGCGVHLKA